MNTVKFDEADVAKNPHGVDVRRLYIKDSAMVSILSLNSGESIKKHITPVDVAFYVLEGKGTVQIGEEKKEVSKDTLIDSPKDIQHCWYNESESLLRVMIIKAPKPTSKTIFLED